MSIMINPTPARQLRSARLWFASLNLIATLQREFFTHWRRVVRSFDADEVHDLRVASRRLREGLALFSPLLPRKKVAGLSRRVKRVTELLGELRNTDEAFLFFSSLDPEESSGCRQETDQLLFHLAKQQDEARKGLERELAELDARALKRQFVTALRPNPFKVRRADPFARTDIFAEQALAERVGLVEELFPAALREEDVVAQHRLRIAFKKLRYRLEILAPLLEDEGEELRQALKRYQDLLGKLHDLDVFAEMVLERVPQGPGREELLRVLAGRRAGLFASFVEAQRVLPLKPLTERVREELSPPRKRQDEAGAPPSPGRPRRRKRG